MPHPVALVAVLIAIGAIPVLPAFLGLAKDHDSRVIQVITCAAASFCLFVCFIESFGGALLTAIMWVLPFGEVAVLGCTAAFFITACVACWRVVRLAKP